MEIKFLKAGSGDSILIHHKGNNVLVDGGNYSKYLKEEIDKINNKDEFINLLIITHHDDDHIKGIIDVLKAIKKGEYREDIIKKVIFNSPRLIKDKLKLKEDKQLSYKQAHLVEELLKESNTKWEKYIGDTVNETLGEDLKINIYPPSEEILKKYSNKSSYLTSDYRCDWGSSMSYLENFINDDSQDNTISNMTSIVITVEADNKKVLLTGDVTPNRFKSILDELKKNDIDIPVKFDYVKLPHHASYRSLNDEIIKSLDCNDFIVSTNSKKHYLPNKRAILKIVKNKRQEKIKFYFNYSEAIENLNISESEKKEYNFELIPNSEDYGFSI